MAIPVKLEILGKRWRVEVKKLEEGDYGDCKPSDCRIRVHPEQTEDNKRDTLLHEILHGIDSEMQTRMSERQVRLTATGLLQVLRSNKRLVAWLMDAD